MIKRILHHFAARLLTSGLGFVVVWLTARYLGASGRGQISLFLTDVSALVLFIGLVGGSSLIYLVPRRNVWHLLRPAYAWAVVVSVLGAGAVGLLRPVSPSYQLHLGAVTLVQALLSINTFLLLGRKREQAFNALMTTQALLLAGALAAAYMLPGGRIVPTYYYANYVAYGLPWLVSLGLLLRLPDTRDHRPPRCRAVARELARHSRGAHLSNILAFANYRLSYYAVAAFAGPKALGVLSVGVALAEAIWLVPRSTALMQYVALVNAADKQQSATEALRVGRLTLLATAVAVVGLALVPAAGLALVFGPEFGAARPVLWCLAPGILLNGTAMQASTYFAGVGRYGVNNRAALLGLAITVPGCVLLVPPLGIAGAALSMSASYGLSMLYLYYHFRRATGAGWSSLLPQAADMRWLWQQAWEKMEQQG